MMWTGLQVGGQVGGWEGLDVGHQGVDEGLDFVGWLHLCSPKV